MPGYLEQMWRSRLCGVIFVGVLSLCPEKSHAESTLSPPTERLTSVPVCEAALGLTAREDSLLDQSAMRSRSMRALAALRSFRQRTLGYDNSTVATTEAVAVDSDALPADRQLLAQRIRGIELNVQEIQDAEVAVPNETAQGLIVSGRNNIREALALLQDGAATPVHKAFTSPFKNYVVTNLKTATVVVPIITAWLIAYKSGMNVPDLRYILGAPLAFAVPTFDYFDKAFRALPSLSSEKNFETYKLGVLDLLNLDAGDLGLANNWSHFAINSKISHVNHETRQLVSQSWLGVDFLFRFRDANDDEAEYQSLELVPELLIFTRALKNPKKHYPKKPKRREETRATASTPLFGWGEPELVPVPIPVPVSR